MKKSEFIELAIKLYEEAIQYARVSKCSTDRLLKYLEKRNLKYGICFLADRSGFGYSKPWISRYTKGCNYICDPPYCLAEKRNIVDGLEKRLKVLQTELKKCR